MFQNYKWFPQCYTLPREKNDLKKKIKDSKKRTFWICKPARGYGGKTKQNINLLFFFCGFLQKT
jgi:hypothetical protein